MRSRTPALVLVLAAVLAAPAAAHAYVLRTAPDGHEVKWADPTAVNLVLHLPPAAVTRDGQAFLDAEARAVSHWDDVAGAHIGVTTTVATGRGEPEAGYDREHPSRNQNDVFFVTGDWPFDPAALGVTVVTYSSTTDVMLDTDILFNAEDHHWAVLDHAVPPDPDGHGPADVESVATHEVGHVLGLMHNTVDPTVTMYPSTGYGEIWMRSLADDDMQGAVALYPATPASTGAPGTDGSGGTGGPGDTGSSGAGAGVPAATRHLGGCSVAGGSAGALPFLLVLLGLVRRRALARLRPVLRRALPALAAVVCLAAPAAAHASRFLPRTLAQATAAADLVVEGRVTGTHSRWQGRLIVTDVHLQVSRCLKGACGDTMDLVTPGGRVGDLVQAVAGIAPYRVGSKVVVFLVHRPIGLIALESGGRFEEVVDGDGRHLALATTGGYRLLPLADLVTRIRTLVAHPVPVPPLGTPLARPAAGTSVSGSAGGR